MLTALPRTDEAIGKPMGKDPERIGSTEPDHDFRKHAPDLAGADHGHGLAAQVEAHQASSGKLKPRVRL